MLPSIMQWPKSIETTQNLKVQDPVERLLLKFEPAVLNSHRLLEIILSVDYTQQNKLQQQNHQFLGNWSA